MASSLRVAILRACLVTVIVTPVVLVSPPTHAQTAGRTYDIPAGSLEGVLARFGRESGILLSFTPALTAGLQSPGLRGSFTVQQGLDALLDGTAIRVQRQPNDSYLLVLAPAPIVAPVTTFSPVIVQAGLLPTSPSDVYAGGQIARSGSLGMLGVADVMDMPFSTTNYTSDLSDNLQARTLADLVQNEASVRVLTGSGGFGEDFQIRGFAVPSGDVGLNGLYGLTSASRMPALMTERVEVLKSSSTLMNGIGPNGSVGGNINIVTKRAGDEPLTRFTSVYQSKNQLGVQADLGRRFGEDKRWGVRVNGAHRDGETGVDDSNQRQDVGVLGLDYAGSRLRWSLDAYTQQEHVDNIRPQVGFTSAVTTVPQPPSGHANFFPGTRLRLDDSVVATRLEYDVSDTVTVYGAVGHRHGQADQIFPSGPVEANGDFMLRNGYYDSYSRTTTGDAGLQARFDAWGIGHTVTLGATYLEQEAGYGFGRADEVVPSNIYRPMPLPPLSGERGPRRKAAGTSLSSWYLADTLALADDRLLITAGLRRQRVGLDNYSTLTGARTSSHDADTVSPLVGVVVKPVENVSMYANFTSGVMRGGTAPTTASNAGEVFAPYKSEQYEAGIKADWGRLATAASIFQVDLPNAVTDPDTNRYSFDGEQRNRGIELSAYGELRRGLRVMASGTFYDARLTRTGRGVNDGNRANGVPSHTYNLSLDWDTPWQGLSLNARLIHTSSLYFNAANTLSLPSWTRYDVGMRYRTTFAGTPAVLRANIENLFNRSAWLASGTYATVSAPRTLLLSVQFDF